MMDQPIGEICICGRWKVKAHCWRCGSYRVTAFSKKETVNRGNGRLEHIQAFRCRICGTLFNDDHRAMCEAPHANVTGRLSAVEKKRLREQKVNVEFKSMDEVPEALAKRIAEIKNLKAEGKW